MIYDQTRPLPHQIRCGLSLHNTASPSMLMIPYSFQNQFAAIAEASNTADLCMHSASSIPLYVDDLPISSKSVLFLQLWKPLTGMQQQIIYRTLHPSLYANCLYILGHCKSLWQSSSGCAACDAVSDCWMLLD